MDLTAAERKRRSRANRTEAEKMIEREKAKIRMKEKRLKIKGDLVLKIKEREAAKLRMQRMREKKKMLATARPETGFSSKESLEKALKQSRDALPLSNVKKIEVVKKLAKEVGLVLPGSSCPKRTSRGISDNTKQKVLDFYYHDDISRIVPGKKNMKSVKDPATNKKTKKQKRLLMLSLKETYVLFKTYNPDLNISFSKFCQLRPKEIITVGSRSPRGPASSPEGRKKIHHTVLPAPWTLPSTSNKSSSLARQPTKVNDHPQSKVPKTGQKPNQNDQIGGAAEPPRFPDTAPTNYQLFDEPWIVCRL